MKFSESLFGHQLNQVTLNELKDFFSIEREESSKIEFKSGEIEIEEIYREICAFLNTDGGILFIGAPREKKIEISKKNFKRVCHGDLIPSKFKNKGWLIQKIASSISPFPPNIEIHEILTFDGNYFILEIPQSFTPPHQCLNEGKYYIRLEDEAKPAPHGIVQSLFFLRQKPNVIISVELGKLIDGPPNEIEIIIKISNDSDIPTENISYLVRFKNIQKVYSDTDHDNSGNFTRKSGDIFILNGALNTVLIKGIFFPIEFFIEHKNQPFLLSIVVWGKDFGLKEKHSLWNPIGLKLIDSLKTGETEDKDFDSLVTRLNELINSEH